MAGPGGGGLWNAQISAGSQTYFQSFSAITPSRTSERKTSEQQIPTTFVAGSGTWVKPIGRHALLLGVEARRVDATLRDTRYSWAGAPLDPTETGGTESAAALFARASLAPTSTVSVDAGIRGEVWQTTPTDVAEAAQSLTSVSPRLSVAWRPTSALVSRSLSAASHVFVAVENLFDVEYDVGRTPVRTVGWPRSMRVGARYTFR